MVGEVRVVEDLGPGFWVDDLEGRRNFVGDLLAPFREGIVCPGMK